MRECNLNARLHMSAKRAFRDLLETLIDYIVEVGMIVLRQLVRVGHVFRAARLVVLSQLDGVAENLVLR